MMGIDLKIINACLKSVELPPVRVSLQNPSEVFGAADSKTLHVGEYDDCIEYFAAEKYLGTAAYRKDGTLMSISPWLNGKPHGVWQEFNSNEELISSVNYTNGEKTGISLRWHDNGLLAFASECKNRFEIATTATWDSNGVLKSWRIEELGGEHTAFICLACRHQNAWKGWDHAGFSERGFLYNEAGDFVITWEARDPAYLQVIKDFAFPWMLTIEQQRRIEQALLPCPLGGSFLFRNPARCGVCNNPIAQPLPECVYLWDPDRMIRSGVGEKYPNGPLMRYFK